MMPQSGQTALLMAALGGHAAAVTLLIDARADVNHASNVRSVILASACVLSA
jgi:ankyrin repeat protein